MDGLQNVSFINLTKQKLNFLFISETYSRSISGKLFYLILGCKLNLCKPIFLDNWIGWFAPDICVYSRLRNKHRATIINSWTFFQGLHSLLGRVMHILFQNICYFMVWGMPILRAMLNIFAKCSRGYVFFRGYIYSRPGLE